MPLFDFECPNKKCGKEKEELVFLRNGEYEKVICECGSEMKRKPNLTSFPGMQMGKHHYGGGTTVMKRRNKRGRPSEDQG